VLECCEHPHTHTHTYTRALSLLSHTLAPPDALTPRAKMSNKWKGLLKASPAGALSAVSQAAGEGPNDQKEKKKRKRRDKPSRKQALKANEHEDRGRSVPGTAQHALEPAIAASDKPINIKTHKTGMAWYRSLGSPAYILSPMVGQSELAFRMLCRNHGVQLAYTPMFISSEFVKSAAYRGRVWHTCPEDRPLAVQFCGNDSATMLQAGLMVQDSCDAIDVNLGCPQAVAQRGGYGAFMMENLSAVARIVRTLADGLSVPVTCKIRVFAEYDKTLAYARLLQVNTCLLKSHPIHQTS
jgi:hypothetical protein